MSPAYLRDVLLQLYEAPGLELLGLDGQEGVVLGRNAQHFFFRDSLDRAFGLHRVFCVEVLGVELVANPRERHSAHVVGFVEDGFVEARELVAQVGREAVRDGERVLDLELVLAQHAVFLLLLGAGAGGAGRLFSELVLVVCLFLLALVLRVEPVREEQLGVRLGESGLRCGAD